MAAVLAGLATMFVLLPLAAQDDPSATRSFDPTTVAPGGTVTVTIAAANYGQLGGVTETLPAGFPYVESSLDASQVAPSFLVIGSGSRYKGDTSFTYTVTASDTAGAYGFSGTLRDADRNDSPVGGAVSVTVEGRRPRGQALRGPSVQRRWLLAER